MQNGAQQTQAVILPLLVRAGWIDEVTQIAQIEPDDLAGRGVRGRRAFAE
jgi:hypothetical protein